MAQAVIYTGTCPICGARLYNTSGGKGLGSIVCLKEQHFKADRAKFEQVWEDFKQYASEVDAVNTLYKNLMEINEEKYDGPRDPDEVLERK